MEMADQERAAVAAARRTTRVLVVEDDATVAEVVTTYLRNEGFDVRWESDGQVGLDTALADPPDLVVLDLMLPSLDGLEVCRRLRATAPVPVVMLTAKGEESDRILGLELGADDYLAKPFSPRELVARVKAVLRRTTTPITAEGPVVEAGGIRVDIQAREASRDGKTLSLTARELELLNFLMRNPRRAFGRDELLEHVWGYTYGDASTVTVHIRRLREKIESNPSEPERIVTVWGVGYRWDV